MFGNIQLSSITTAICFGIATLFGASRIYGEEQVIPSPDGKYCFCSISAKAPPAADWAPPEKVSKNDQILALVGLQQRRILFSRIGPIGYVCGAWSPDSARCIAVLGPNNADARFYSLFFPPSTGRLSENLNVSEWNLTDLTRAVEMKDARIRNRKLSRSSVEKVTWKSKDTLFVTVLHNSWTIELNLVFKSPEKQYQIEIVRLMSPSDKAGIP